MSWQEADPEDYEAGKEWEWNASVQAMLSVKDDLEPLPLFNRKGQQVGIGIGLYWWNDQGQLRCHCEDESRPCRDSEEHAFWIDDDDRVFSYCAEDFQRFSARDDE